MQTRLLRTSFRIGIAGLMLSGLLTLQATAQEAATSSTRQAPGDIPEVFSQPNPRNVADLQAMQDHVTALIPKLEECTVSLRIGGAQGTGVIVTASGDVLTAAHVSGRPGRRVSIVTSDGKTYRGVSLGRNRTMDASMIHILSDRNDWPHAPLAEKEARAGDWCLVMGHPGGYQEERGIVVRFGRVILKNDFLIQTDCELVGGDSGGPLFNMRGEVLGINTRIGESTDLNFHVPVEIYAHDWDRLLASEDFRSNTGAFLGVSGVANPNGRGLTLNRITPGEAAEEAGLKVGDILLTFEGEDVDDLEELIEMVGSQLPGKLVTLEYERDGGKQKVEVQLGSKP